MNLLLVILALKQVFKVFDLACYHLPHVGNLVISQLRLFLVLVEVKQEVIDLYWGVLLGVLCNFVQELPGLLLSCLDVPKFLLNVAHFFVHSILLQLKLLKLAK